MTVSRNYRTLHTTGVKVLYLEIVLVSESVGGLWPARYI